MRELICHYNLQLGHMSCASSEHHSCISLASGELRMGTCQDVFATEEHMNICPKVIVDTGLLSSNVTSSHNYQPAESSLLSARGVRVRWGQGGGWGWDDRTQSLMQSLGNSSKL